MPRIQNTAPYPGFLAMALPENAPAKRLREAGHEGVAVGALTRAVRAGDMAAFAQFYDIYALRVYKHLLVLARGDEIAAREILQAVAIKLAQKMQAFEDERALHAWLHTVARHAFVDHCRARKRDAHLVSVEEILLKPDASANPAHALGESLRLAMADCTPEERELLQAAYVDKRPLAELAAQTGQTYKALESRLARLRAKVRAQLLSRLRHENRS